MKIRRLFVLALTSLSLIASTVQAEELVVVDRSGLVRELYKSLESLAALEGRINGMDYVKNKKDILGDINDTRKRTKRALEILERADSVEGGHIGLGVSGVGIDMQVNIPPDHIDHRVEVVEVIHEPLEPPMEEVYEMDPSEFNSFISALESADFSDEKMALIKEVGGQNYFTVAQVSRVVGVLDFSKEKVDAVVFLYPNIVDQNNFYKVYENFDFDSDKKAVRKRLGL